MGMTFKGADTIIEFGEGLRAEPERIAQAVQVKLSRGQAERLAEMLRPIGMTPGEARKAGRQAFDASSPIRAARLPGESDAEMAQRVEMATRAALSSDPKTMTGRELDAFAASVQRRRGETDESLRKRAKEAAAPRFEVKWHPQTTHIRTSKDGFQKIEVKTAHINGNHYGLALDTTQHVLWFVSDSPDDLDKNRHLLQALAGGASVDGEAALSDVLRGKHMTHPADINVKPVPPRKELFLQAITLCAEEAIALGASAQELRHALYAGLGLGDD